MLILFFIGHIGGYYTVWIIGDEFVKSTFNQIVVSDQNQNYYLKHKFDIEEFSSDRLAEGNILARLCNDFMRALNTAPLLPKLVVMTIDSDISKNIPGDGDGIMATRILDICVNYVIKILHRAVAECKEVFPERAVRQKFPTIMWIIPPGHCNFTDNCQRAKVANILERVVMQFNDILERVVMQFNEMRFTRLTSWDSLDQQLVLRTQNGYRFTARGLSRYWLAVDDAIQAWDAGSRNGHVIPSARDRGYRVNRGARGSHHKWLKNKLW